MPVYFSEDKKTAPRGEKNRRREGNGSEIDKERRHIHGNLHAGDEEMQTKAAAEERREEIERDRYERERERGRERERERERERGRQRDIFQEKIYSQSLHNKDGEARDDRS